MISQSTWRRAYAGAKVTVGAGVVAGLMAFSVPAQAATLTDPSPLTSLTGWNVGGFGVTWDEFLSTRIYDSSFAGTVLEIDYLFLAEKDLPTQSTATALNPDPPTQPGFFGIANLVLTWYDKNLAELSSQTFTNAQGVLDTTAILSQVIVNTHDYTLRLAGTVLTDGGGYQLRVTAVPLPAALLLFLSGLAGVGFLGRYNAKRRREPELV